MSYPGGVPPVPRRSLGPLLAACLAAAGAGCDDGRLLRPDASRDSALPTDGGECEPWSPAMSATSLMLPGAPCLDCHFRVLGPSDPMTVAGTVFADVRQREGCPGVSGVRVIVTDADGTEVAFTTNLAGNFYIRRELTFPIRVRLEDGELSREMEGEVDTGSCNTCHTPEGAEMAPGRVVAPLP